MASNAAFVGYAQGASLPGEDAYETFDFTPQARKTAPGLSWSDWTSGEPTEREVGRPVEPTLTDEPSDEFNHGVADHLSVMIDDSAPETADTESDTGVPAPGEVEQGGQAVEPNDGDGSASVNTANDEPEQLVWISELDERDLVYGSEGSDVIDTGAGNDAVSAGAGDDIIYASPGTDYLSGDEGFDMLVLTGAASDYQLYKLDGFWFEVKDVRDGGQSTLPGTDGWDQVHAVEAIKFGDGSIVSFIDLLAG